MLLRCCKDELRGSLQRLLGAATPAAAKKTRQDPLRLRPVEGPSSAPSTMTFRARTRAVAATQLPRVLR